MGKTFGIRFDHNTIHVAVTEKTDDGKTMLVDACTRKVPLTPEERQSFETVKENKEIINRRERISSRRNHQRYLLRRKNLIDTLKEHGFITDATPLMDSEVSPEYSTWERRATAVTQKVSLEDLARIFLMMNKHRGYKETKGKKDANEGFVIDGSEHAIQMQKLGMTPAQYLRHLKENDISDSITFYPSDLKSELGIILNGQRVFYPELLTDNLLSAAYKGEIKEVLKMLPSVKSSLKQKEQKEAIIAARAQAADGEAIPEDMLSSVITSLMRQISNSSEYLGMISDRSKDILINNQTPGQWMWEKMSSEGKEFSTKSKPFFRIDYKNEFDRIWKTQKQFYPQLKDELYKIIKDYVLFYQRDLKAAKGGYCPYESKKVTDKNGTHFHGCRTAPKSSPLFQEFRVMNDLNNVRYTNQQTNEVFVLDREMLDKVSNVLRRQETIKDTSLLKLLNLDSKLYKLNFKEVQGNTTYAAIYNALARVAKSKGYKDPQTMLEKTGADSSLLDYDWNLPKKEYERQSFVRLWILIDSYVMDDSISGMETLRKQIKERFGVDEDSAHALSMVSFADGHGSLSHKAMKKLLPHLKEGTGYYDACLAEGYIVTETKKEGNLLTKMPIVKKGEMFNPIAEKIINQVINVMNTLIEEYGNPELTVVEMPRELNESKEFRKANAIRIKQREEENKRYTKEITAITGNPNVTASQLLRYRLYLELKENGYRTLYSNKKIEPHMVFDVNVTHKEHIIPQSVIFDDNYVNYTLELADVDSDKKDMPARDYVLSKYGQKGLEEYEERVKRLYEKNAISKAKYNYLLMTTGQVPNNILDRQTPARQYAMKQFAKMLALVSEKVLYTTSGVTKTLKRDWELNEVITEVNAKEYKPYNRVTEEKNADGKSFTQISVRVPENGEWVSKRWNPSSDPRSGMVDAVVVACTTPSHIALLNNLCASKEKDSYHWKLRCALTTFKDGVRVFKLPMPKEILIREITRLVENTIVSTKTSERLASTKINVIRAGKNKKDIKTQKTMVPRGALHESSVFRRIMVGTPYTRTLNARFGLEQVMSVVDPTIRKILIDRLAEYDNDAALAFKKEELKKRPLWIDEKQKIEVPSVLTCKKNEARYIIRKAISKKINVDKIYSEEIRTALQERIKQKGSLEAATEDLISNPLIVNGKTVKRVMVIEKSECMVPVRFKRDHTGQHIKDENGNLIPCDFVLPGDNHHLSIYKDQNGNLEVKLVTFLESIARINKKKDPYDKGYKAEEGWSYLYHICKGDTIIFPDEENDFLPEKMTVDELNASPLTRKNLFFVQKMSQNDYIFRHHTDNSVSVDPEMKNFKYKKCKNGEDFKGSVKVNINHIGKIIRKH